MSSVKMNPKKLSLEYDHSHTTCILIWNSKKSKKNESTLESMKHKLFKNDEKLILELQRTSS